MKTVYMWRIKINHSVFYRGLWNNATEAKSWAAEYIAANDYTGDRVTFELIQLVVNTKDVNV